MPTWYERMPTHDIPFLAFEGPDTHMHIGGTAILDAGPLTLPGGGMDIDRVRAYVGSRLHLAPRYRQRLARVPIEDGPVWVDDDHFNLTYHVRHTALPRPGDEEQLKRLSGRIFSQQLDRGKPLWELWVVEGLESGRFAMIVKTHHCMVDGLSGFDLFASLLTLSPDEPVGEAPRWIPRPAPGGLRLLRDEVVRRATLPGRMALELARGLRAPRQLGRQVVESATAVWRLADTGFRSAAPTPVNRPTGPHRRFDWLALDLEDVKSVRNRLGGTVNDVVLASVAGAVGRFLTLRGVYVRRLGYKVVVPVNVRLPEERGVPTNRVSAWLMELPIGERDPRRRYETVVARTRELKEARQELGPVVLGRATELVGPRLLSLGVRLTAQVAPYNLIVTNLPGPQVPLYILGAPLLTGFPQVPLFEDQGLAIGLFSYCGHLGVGVTADWDLVPDLRQFIEALEDSFRELTDLAVERPGAAVGA